MRILSALALLCLVIAVAAKKPHKEERAESKSHSTQKYTKEHQGSHHHKKQEELVNEAEPRAKQAPIEVPEPEVELQENLETSKVTAEERQKDLHLQDLAYEENLKKKEKKKKGHHGAHPADVVDKRSKEAEKKLFADHESPVDEKVIEDTFEPLPQEIPAESKKNKQETKKSKNKKKAYEKKNSKHEKNGKHGKKHKDGKKNKEKKNREKN